MSDSPSIEDLKMGTEEHREFFEAKEQKRLDFFSQAIIDKYGPEAREAVFEANKEVLIERMPKNILTFAAAVAERYGPEALDIIAEANRQMWYERTRELMEELDIKERGASAAMKILTFAHTGRYGVPNGAFG